MKHLLGFLLINFLFIMALEAQNATSSPYSIYGLGSLENRSLGAGLAMGDVQTALIRNTQVNISNPSSYASLLHPTMDLGVAYRSLSFQDNSTSNTASNSYFRNVAFAFPVINNRWGAAFGLVPYTRVGYNITDSSLDNELGQINYEYYGTGGLNKVFVGQSVNLLTDTINRLAVGINGSFIFGKIDRTRDVMPDSAVNVFNLRDVKSMLVNGFQMDLGVHYTRRINEKLNTTIGATYSLGDSIKTQTIHYARNFAGSGPTPLYKDTVLYDTLVSKSFIPHSLSLGVSFYINKKWNVGFDYVKQDWSSFELFNSNQGLTQRELFLMGLEYIPDAKDISNLGNVLRYRAGFKYSKHEMNINGEALNGFSTTVGLGIPILSSKSASAINFGLEIGSRGKDNGFQIKEQFTNVYFGVILAPHHFDKWFVKPKIN